MDSAQISQSMKEFIVGHFASARRRPLNDGDPLIESGIIDSLGVLDVVAFVESEFEVQVDDEELTAENFQTIACIAAYVEKKRGRGGN
jgi:acyl carrier protein